MVFFMRVMTLSNGVKGMGISKGFGYINGKVANVYEANNKIFTGDTALDVKVTLTEFVTPSNNKNIPDKVRHYYRFVREPKHNDSDKRLLLLFKSKIGQGNVLIPSGGICGDGSEIGNFDPEKETGGFCKTCCKSVWKESGHGINVTAYKFSELPKHFESHAMSGEDMPEHEPVVIQARSHTDESDGATEHCTTLICPVGTIITSKVKNNIPNLPDRIGYFYWDGEVLKSSFDANEVYRWALGIPQPAKNKETHGNKSLDVKIKDVVDIKEIKTL